MLEFIIPPGKTKPRMSIPKAFIRHTGISFLFSLPGFNISRLNHLFVCGVSFGVADHVGLRAFSTGSGSFTRTSLFVTVYQNSSYTDYFLGDTHNSKEDRCDITLENGTLSATLNQYTTTKIQSTIKNMGFGKLMPPRLSLGEPHPTQIILEVL
jgi:hypothetical protein